MAELQLDRILVTTDLSQSSEAALEAVRALADDFEAKITLLHVTEPADEWNTLASPSAASNTGATSRTLKARIQDELDQMCGRLLGDASRARTVIVDGRVAWKTICDYALDHEYDLIAIATQGRSNVAGTLIGSVAERVMRYAPCPALSVRPLFESQSAQH
jgi:universal stress protein A